MKSTRPIQYRGYRQHHDGTMRATVTFDDVGATTIVRSASGRILQARPTARFTEPEDITRAAQILELVCKQYKVTTAELESKLRSWRVVWPRHLAIYLIHRHTAMSREAIAHLVNRDASSVRSAIITLENDIETSPAAARQLAALEKAVESL